MQKNRYVSKLDLKFLDMKFLTIDSTDNSINQSFREKRNRSLEFPPINYSTSDITVDNLEQSFLKVSKKKRKTAMKTVQSQAQLELSQEMENTRCEIEKYRKKINLVKKENDLIHKEIVGLYHGKEHDHDRDTHFKNIKKIEIYSHEKLKGLSPGINGNLNLNPNPPKSKTEFFYEHLYSTSSQGCKEELDVLKDKFTNSNLHKNFEQYLLNKNKRVPQFIKRLR